MSRKMKKNELMEALHDRGIAFNKKSKVEQLRRIYDETIGDVVQRDDVSDEIQATAATAVMKRH